LRNKSSLVVGSLDDPAAAQVLPPEYAQGVKWSPDGSKIAFMNGSRAGKVDGGLYVYSVADGALHSITRIPWADYQGPGSPRNQWSGDSQLLVFTTSATTTEDDTTGSSRIPRRDWHIVGSDWKLRNLTEGFKAPPTSWAVTQSDALLYLDDGHIWRFDTKG